MRTLTSIQNQTLIKTDFSITLTNSGFSDTFDISDITNLSKISWETSLKGGFAAPSSYRVTIASSLDYIKSNLGSLRNANTSLSVTVNSDTFVPHTGKVKTIDRNSSNPNLFTLNIYDQTLEKKPKFPESLTDSYSNLHPATIDADWGRVTYYGKQSRPYYFTPVECNLYSLLGPLNISSANHVNSVWYLTSNDKPIENQFINSNLLFVGEWKQDDTFVNSYSLPSTSHVDSHFGFELTGTGTTNNRKFKFDNTTYESLSSNAKSQINSEGNTSTLAGGFAQGTMWQYGSTHYTMSLPLNVTLNDPVYAIGRFNYSISLSKNLINYTYLNTILRYTPGVFYDYTWEDVSIDEFGTFIATTSNTTLQVSSVYIPSLISGDNYFTNSGTITYSHGINNPKSQLYFDETRKVEFLFTTTTSLDPVALGNTSFVCSMDFTVHMKSEAYDNYKVFALPVNSSDIAISENPITIINNIFSSTGIQSNSSSVSSAEFLTSSYNMNCIFSERQEVLEIANEFAEITATNMWVGDDGFVNFKTYQNSDSSIINQTITTSDMYSFRIQENPLGVTTFNKDKLSAITLKYDYVYHRQRYRDQQEANPSNNSFCTAAFSSGISTEKTIRNRTIVESATASYYLDNIVKFNTQPEEYIEMDLPARFFELELCDVLKVQHPMIVGSESVYQIVKVDHNYLNGSIYVKAQELL